MTNMQTTRILLGLTLPSLLLIGGVQAQAQSQNSGRAQNTSIAVLFKIDHLGARNATLDAVQRGRPEELPEPALRQYPPSNARVLIRSDPDFLVGSDDSPRGKLARYIQLDFPPEVDIANVVRLLQQSPAVSFVALPTGAEPSVPTACPTPYDEEKIPPDPVQSWTSVSKTWGQSAVRVSQGQQYQEGHAYIGIVDTGLDPTHSKLKAFQGSSTTFIGGGFSDHMSFYTGNTSGAQPGNFNGYLTPNVATNHYTYRCDDALYNGNGNGQIEMKWVGHGTAVSGILVSNNTLSSDVKGVCKHCSASMAKYLANDTCVGSGTHNLTGVYYEGIPAQFGFGDSEAFTILTDIGAQVINFSGGDENSATPKPHNYCTMLNNLFANSPPCLAIANAVAHDVTMFAASGNNAATNQTQWPASDPRVYGVGGIRPTDKLEWRESATCGSSHGSASSGTVSFVAPAVGIYTTMDSNMAWQPNICHEWNDGVAGNGFGYCSGTSMATPFASGVAGLVRSTNPLLSRAKTHSAMSETADRSNYGFYFNYTYGWGIPQADAAVRRVLGKVNNVTVKNRAIPLFSLYGNVAKDYLVTTKPQIALAFFYNGTWQYHSDSSSPPVSGYSFPNPPGYAIETPRADMYVLSTKVSSIAGKTLVPLYRMRYAPAGSTNADGTLVEGSKISSFKGSSYEMEGVEGYVYAPCTPEPSCMPPGSETLWRAYNSTKLDYAVFPNSKYQLMTVTNSYSSGITKLGYAYPNIDSDGDGLIDGLEREIGTNPNLANSNCGGGSDGSDYPLASLPVLDPLYPNYCN